MVGEITPTCTDEQPRSRKIAFWCLLVLNRPSCSQAPRRATEYFSDLGACHCFERACPKKHGASPERSCRNNKTPIPEEPRRVAATGCCLRARHRLEFEWRGCSRLAAYKPDYPGSA